MTGYIDYASISLSEEDKAANQKILGALERIRAQLNDSIFPTLQLPEPGYRLDLDSRKDSPIRQCKHIAQLCLMGTEHFKHTNRIKTNLLLHGYLRSVDDANPITAFLLARAALELAAFLNRVRTDLDAITQGPESDWRSRGESFFRTLVRARFATTNPPVRKHLLAQGVPEKNLKPFNVMECLRQLAQVPMFETTIEDYDRLCDFVHHNCSSMAMFAAGAQVANMVEAIPGGGKILIPGMAAFTRYAYPSERSTILAVKLTCAVVHRSILTTVEHINACPEKPLRDEEIARLTGSSTAYRVLTPGASEPLKKVGRNDPCPCGSGLKYKKCCLRD